MADDDFPGWHAGVLVALLLGVALVLDVSLSAAFWILAAGWAVVVAVVLVREWLLQVVARVRG